MIITRTVFLRRNKINFFWVCILFWYLRILEFKITDSNAMDTSSRIGSYDKTRTLLKIWQNAARVGVRQCARKQKCDSQGRRSISIITRYVRTRWMKCLSDISNVLFLKVQTSFPLTSLTIFFRLHDMTLIYNLHCLIVLFGFFLNSTRHQLSNVKVLVT